MSMRSSSLLFVLTIFSGACAGGAVQSPAARPAMDAPTDPTRWEGDPRLYRMLMAYPITPVQYDSLEVYAMQAGQVMNNLLADAAADRHAPAAVRANALHMLARRQAGTHLSAFRTGLDDDDVRVRATAVAAMREFNTRYPMEALQLARMALRDTATEVQAQALPIIGDRDIPLLRAYHARTANPELRRIADEIIAVAEERGAPLAGDTATGVLRRTSAHGYTVTFTPSTRWPEWGAAVGRVSVAGEGITPFTADSVEAVADVVPLYFSTDGAYAVYERARRIIVRTLASGEERDLGAGIAPRIRPFTDQFVYMVEAPDGRRDLRERTHIRYQVMNAGFNGAPAPSELGALGAFATYGSFGNYSPVRWMRVEDRGGSWYLTGDGIEAFALPDPFAAVGR